MKKVLLIIDPQYDFINGSLKVKDAVSKMYDLSSYIFKKGNEYDLIIVTQDWHPDNHISFQTWPKHCVQSTHGAYIFKPLMDKINNYNHLILKKGSNFIVDEYSIMRNDIANNIIKSLIETNTEIHVCGIAGDICVLNTVDDLLKNGYNNIVLFKNFIASINDDVLNNFIKDKKLSYIPEKTIFFK